MRRSSEDATLLCHLSILLLETFAQSLGTLQELIHTTHDTALLFAQQALAREVVDTIGEAALYEVRVHLSMVSLNDD